MNILAIHNYYKQRGGEDVVFENETKALEDAGHKVIIYSKNNEEIDNYSLLQKFTFLFSAINNKKSANELKKIIKDNKIDIAHIHNVFPMISPSAYKILKKNKVKIVQTIHNYRFLCPNGLFYGKDKNCMICAKGNFWHCVIRKCFKNSYILSFLYSYIIKKNQGIFKKYIDGYIALTEYTKNIFVDFGYDKEKFYIKDNGYVDNGWERKRSEGYFLFLGRISKEKGIDFLLESFKDLPEYKLIVAGTGSNIEYYKELYDYKNIQFLGFVDGEKKRALIEEAEALIMPSICYDNYPLSIVESFCVGIPIIGAKIGGIPYIVENEKSGLLFNVVDFRELRDALSRMENNSKLRTMMGNNAREVYINRMEMGNNIKRLEGIYSNIINKRVNVGGILFSNVNMDEAIEIMEKRIRKYNGEGASLLCAANQDSVRRISEVNGLSHDSINGSFLIIPDGYSIVAASKFLGKPLKERVAGPDLMKKFIEVSAGKGYKNFFLGAKEGIASKLANILKDKYPDLKISGIYSPPFGEFSKEENDKMIKMINESKSDILWVSFGCPKQEEWIVANKDKLNLPIAAGIGAAFDFLSGNKKRAPLFMQNIGLEWFYRFCQEPFRMWNRYFVGGIKFIKIIIIQKFF